jgi:hypothetical protein
MAGPRRQPAPRAFFICGKIARDLDRAWRARHYLDGDAMGQGGDRHRRDAKSIAEPQLKIHSLV